MIAKISLLLIHKYVGKHFKIMNFDDIKKELNNPEFKIDLSSLIFSIRSVTLLNNYHLQEILKKQIELIELQKGKTGQELDSAVESELESLDDKFSERLKEDLIDDINDFSNEKWYRC